MELLGIEMDIKQGPGGRTTIACEALGYLTIAETLDEAIEDIREFIRLDPALSSVPAELKKVQVNLASHRLLFQFSPELFPALLSKIRKVRKIEFKDIAEACNAKSIGSISKYFSASSPTMPQINTLSKLMAALGTTITIGPS